MQTINQKLIHRIQALKSRGEQCNSSRELLSLIKNDYSFKNEIKLTYLEVFNKNVSGCNNCFADAFFELVKLLKENNKIGSKEKVNINEEFVLLDNVLLYDIVNLDSSKTLSSKNITNELALYHLSTNPDCIEFFTKLPQNWKQQITDYKNNI